MSSTYSELISSQTKGRQSAEEQYSGWRFASRQHEPISSLELSSGNAHQHSISRAVNGAMPRHAKPKSGHAARLQCRPAHQHQTALMQNENWLQDRHCMAAAGLCPGAADGCFHIFSFPHQFVSNISCCMQCRSQANSLLTGLSQGCV